MRITGKFGIETTFDEDNEYPNFHEIKFEMPDDSTKEAVETEIEIRFEKWQFDNITIYKEEFQVNQHDFDLYFYQEVL